MQAVAYLRVSSSSQAADDKDGLPRQAAAIDHFAQYHGHTIQTTFTEVYTGTKLGEREALASMMVYLGDHPEVEAVLVENLDRLSRDTLVGLLLMDDLKKAGVAVLTIDGRDAAQDDPTAKLLTVILMGLASYQRDMLVGRMALGRAKIRARGERCEGRKPYGTRPGEAKIKAEAIKLREQGRTLAQVAETLNNLALYNSQGNPWTVSSIQRLLKKRNRRGQLVLSAPRPA